MIPETPLPVGERSEEKMNLYKELMDVTQSQYKKVKDKKRICLLLDVYYPTLCHIAEITGGCVKLDIDEQALIGRMRYVGIDLVFNRAFSPDSARLSDVISATDQFSISASDGRFVLNFMFLLYKNERLADHSDRIRQIRSDIRKLG